MKIALQSFFIDYYDHWFDSRHEADEVWYRRGDLPPYKDEAFNVLEKAGFIVPEHGPAKQFRERGWRDDLLVVAYYDPKAHTSYGKYLTQLKDVYYEDMYCSQFIDLGKPARSTRHLWIGERCFRYVLTSDHEWMSNTGNDFEISDFREITDQVDRRAFNYPLYAIDFVGPYAVDLNRCPGLKGTGIEDFLTSKECADAIIEYAQKYDFEGKERAKGASTDS